MELPEKYRRIPQDRETRLNTGVIAAENDWPGVFIRGDEIEGAIFELLQCAGNQKNWRDTRLGNLYLRSCAYNGDDPVIVKIITKPNG